MTKKTNTQEEKEIKAEERKSRLLSKGGQIFEILKDETVNDALHVLKFCSEKINLTLNLEESKRVLRDIWPEDLAK